MDKKLPFCGVLKSILQKEKNGILLEELTRSALQSWGRNFPATHYNPVALVYKLSGLFLPVEFQFPAEPVMIVRGLREAEQLQVSPKLAYHELNQIAEELKQVKVKLLKEE